MMKDLEKALKNLPQPHIQVAVFKRNLRADLLSKKQPHPKPYYLGFAISTTLASAFATLLVLFIFNPQYPQNIRAWLDGSDRGSQIQTNRTHDFEPKTGQWNPPLTLNQTQVAERTIYPSEEIDRRYVEDLFAQRFANQKPRLQSVTNKGVYSIREFVAEDGKRVLVYTQIDEPIPSRSITVSY